MKPKPHPFALAATHGARRVGEEQFLEMAGRSGTVILDARTRLRYDAIHVKGALHLAFTEFTEESLRQLIPDKDTCILIYCNNNFENEPVHFARKSAPVSLNVQTFVNLHAYGYRNVYELGPLLDVHRTRIPFAGKEVGTDGRPKVRPAAAPSRSPDPLPALQTR